MESEHVSVAEKAQISTQQMTALTMKLAELQSHILRLNALGDRLADEASIPEKEFNFQQTPASGGPMTQAGSLTKRRYIPL